MSDELVFGVIVLGGFLLAVLFTFLTIPKDHR